MGSSISVYDLEQIAERYVLQLYDDPDTARLSEDESDESDAETNERL
jgi:hypothetical protein